jgi:hypothetical protein
MMAVFSDAKSLRSFQVEPFIILGRAAHILINTVSHMTESLGISILAQILKQVGLVTAMEMIVLQGESKSVSPFCSR